MRRILLGILLAFLACNVASAQNAQIYAKGVATCGGQSLTAGVFYPVTQDLTGTLCSTGGGGGGGGGTSSVFGAAFPASGTAAGFTDGTNMVAGRVRTPGSSAVTSDAALVVVDPNVLAAINAPIPSQSPAVPIGGVGICDGANGTTNPCTNPATVKAASTPAAASDKALVVDQRPGTNITINPYPSGAVPYTNSATGTTTGAVATLAGAASVTTYICGFSVRANATAAATVNVVVSGTISGSLNFTEWVAPAASGLGIAEMIFNPCIPASAANTSVVVTGGAPGAGGVNSTTAWGYKL